MERKAGFRTYHTRFIIDYDSGPNVDISTAYFMFHVSVDFG